MKKGQASVELLILLAVSLIFITVIFSYSNESINQLNNQKQLSIAQTSVNDLRDAANDVYAQGVGARKKVFYVVPNSSDLIASGIDGKTFVINLFGTDVYAKSNAPLIGLMPVTVGGHEVWLTAHENYVAIGSQNISVDKTSSYVTLLQDETDSDSIIISNIGTETATINLIESWSHSDVTINISPSNFSLNQDSQQVVNIEYTSNTTASGNYSGTLYIGADFPTLDDENLSIPLNAEVTVAGGGGGEETALFIFPSTHSVNLSAGAVDSNSFTICNNGTLASTNIVFTDSGTISSWIDSITTISNLAGGACEPVNFTITVPGGTTPGNYTGTITALDADSATDSLEITVTVISSMASDFLFDWSTASFTSNTQIGNWTIENTGTGTISIEKITVSGWSTQDQDSAQLNRIQLLDSTSYWTGTANDGEEVTLTSNANLLTSTSYTQNELRFTQNVNDDFERFNILFTFTDGSSYQTEWWPNRYTVDLWEYFSDLPQPLDFSTDVNSTENTFGAGAGNDGWDWSNDVYVDGDDIFRFNADPNYDNSIADSTVGSQNYLMLELGDYGTSQNSGTNANGAYGVQFEITSEQYAAIVGGATATLVFYWYMDDSGIDNGEAVWVKAAIGNIGGMNYLGSNLDGGLDATNDIEYDSNPNDHGASESFDVTSYITGAGNYYLEFGGRLSSWSSNNEDVKLRFDNINLTIE